MNDEQNAKKPSDQTNDNPCSESPAIKPAPTQNKIGDDSQTNTNRQTQTAKELAREFRWIEVWTLIINGVLAIVGIVALCIYGGQLGVMKGQLGNMSQQLGQMQQQTTLMRQQLIGSQAAVVKADFGYGATFESHPFVDMMVRNEGHVVTRDVHISVLMTKERIRPRAAIGSPIPIDVVIPVMQGDKANIVSRRYPLHFSQSELALLKDTKMSVRMEGFISYDNGFGEVVKEKSCSALLSFSATIGNAGYGGTQFWPCDILPVVLEDYDRIRIEAQKQNKEKH